jgi:hypothetical protein
MSHTYRAGLLLGVVAWLALLPPAHAQRVPAPRSHRPYVAITPDGDLEQILKNNLERMRGLENMRGILDKLRDSGLFKDSSLLKRLENLGNLDPDTPEAKKAFQDVMETMKQNPEFARKAKDMVPQLKDQDIRKQIEKVLKEDVAKANPNNGGKIDPKNPVRAPVPQEPENLQPPDEGDFSNTVQNWLERAKNWKGVGDLVSNSPAIQQAIDEFTLSMLDPEAGGQWDANGWADRFGNVADLAERGSNLLGDGWAGVSNLPLPSPPSIRLPNLSLGGLPSVRLPNLGGPSGPGGGGLAFGRFMLWAGLILTVGLIAWQLFGRLSGRTGSRARQGSGWRLGPWPVNPARVATREELIRAFEFLSLLLLGPEARTWNHLDLAAGMGAEAPASLRDPRQAANRLAALYEQARYAPEEEPWSAETLAEARRDLCSLAGVAAA